MRSTCGQGGIRAVAMRSTCGQGGIRAVVVRSPCWRGGIRAVVVRSPCRRGGIRAVVMRLTYAPKGNTGDGHAFNVRPGGATSPQPRAIERSEATPWVVPRRQRGAPGGGKSSDRGDVGWRLLPGVAGVRRVAGFMPVNGGVYARWWRNESFLSLLLPPPGAYRKPFCLTQGVASLRSLALGWGLATPSGFSLSA